MSEVFQLRVRTKHTFLTAMPSSPVGHAVSISSTGGGHRGVSRAVSEVTGHIISGLQNLSFSISANRRLTDIIQQTNLALNVSETIINLHRPYYAKALYDVDRFESIYKSSFYTVIERCGVSIRSKHP